MSTEKRTLDTADIMQVLPHRYPFLLIDKVLDYKEGEYLQAIKNVTANEPMFTGHFPEYPVFPGVLMLEAMAQATGILAYKSFGLAAKGELYYFASVDNAKFRKPVLPGDQMVIDVDFHKERRGVASFSGVIKVDGKIVCSADLKCARKPTGK